jgi:hypothetical protein
MDDVEERRLKKARLAEHREFDQILLTSDYQDQCDLAAHLLLAAQYKRKQGGSKKGQGGRRRNDATAIHDTWTAWPLPSKIVPRPTPASSSSSQNQENPSSALHAEIEATILRIARSRIQSEGGMVSANEHPPYQVTREVTNHVVTKLDRLLHALGRIKYQLSSQRSKHRLLKSKWDEIVGIAAISECVDSPDTMKRITERCNKLFEEDIPWETEEK